MVSVQICGRDRCEPSSPVSHSCSQTSSPRYSGCEKLRQTVGALCQILSDSGCAPSKGLSASSSSSSLSSQDGACLDAAHWLEVADPRHRYGTALRPYYDAWVAQGERGCRVVGESFFHFLDEGAGKNLNLNEHFDHVSCVYKPSRSSFRSRPKRCLSRAELESCQLEYCDAEQRKQYIVEVVDNKLVWQNSNDRWCRHEPLNTGAENKWIFVMDAVNNIYVNRKIKGRFHHSCFMAGGRVRAAGRLVVENGRVISIAPYSGHYRPIPDSVNRVIDVLKEAGMDTAGITVFGWTAEYGEEL